MATGWDTNKLKKLKVLISKGLSTSEIGKRLEMSKNAVVGKLNRLGWNLKATTGSTVRKASAESGGEPKKSVAKKSKLPVSKKIAPVKPVVMPKVKVVTKKTEKKPVAKPVKESKVEKKVATKVVPEDKPVVKHLPRAVESNKKSGENLAMHQRIIQHSLEMAALKPNQCRWPIGDPDSENFHFCGETVFVGKPYCYEHCRQAYQFTAPKKK